MAKEINTTTQNFTDIDLSVIRKKRFRIDGDDNKILELNTSDLNILARLKEAYPKLVDLADNAFKKLPEVDDSSEDYDFMTDESTGQVIDTLKKADEDMRELIDYIFDSNVSEICASTGSMYDPINGNFRFEHIITALASVYEADVASEMNKMATRVQKHTNKYTKKRK